jgi:hypothetical protein
MRCLGTYWSLISVGRMRAPLDCTSYERTESHLMTGTVAKLEWPNPHTYFYVAVEDDAGKETAGCGGNGSERLYGPAIRGIDPGHLRSMNSGTVFRTRTALTRGPPCATFGMR